MSSASLWSRLVRSIAGTKTTQKSIKRPLRAFPSLESLEGRTVPATAILNPTGGVLAGDGIRTEFADGQFMVYKNNQFQLYFGRPVPNEFNYNSIYLTIGNSTIGGEVAGYGADPTFVNGGLNAHSNMTESNWTSVNTSTVSTSGASSFFTSSMSYTNATGTYVVDLKVDYTAPDLFHKQTYTVTIPNGNTKDVRLYTAYDTYLGGSDEGPGYLDSTGNPLDNNGIKSVGVYGPNVTESIDYVSGIAWEGYASVRYSHVYMSNAFYGPGYGTPYTNLINTDPTTDNGMGINWNFGSTPGVKAPVAYNFSFNAPRDTTPPATPVITSVTVDTGSSTTDQITSDNTLTFTGTAEANSVVKVFNGTTLIGTTTASGTGAYAVTASVLPDGTYPNFRVTATDAAGNQSGAATVTPWTIDTTAPATPLVASVTVDTGISTTDQITSENTLTVTGTAAANSIVKVFDGGVLVGTTTASGTGAYSVTTSVLADGVHSALTVTANDLAGNASGAATITPWTIDTVAPVVDMVADTTDSDGTYKKNQTLTIELTLDEVVYVTGIPCLDLNSGGLAEYVSGSGTNTLVFTYLIQPGDSTPVGSFLSVLGFDLTNGSISDAAGNIPALLLNTVTNGNLDANNQLVVESRVGVTLVPYAGSFIDDTVTPGSGKTNLASLSYLATFDEIVDNFPRQALQTSGLLLTSVHRIADKTGLHWKIDAKPTNALGTVGSTSIQIVASTFTDVFMYTNLASNVVTVDVLCDMKMTSTLSAGANSAKVVGRVTTLSGLSVVFSGPVDPTTVVASAFNTYTTGVISNIVVAADNLSATFDLNINNGGTAFNGSVRFNVIDKAIQDEYGNKVKGSKQIQWTYDGQGATAVFGSSAAARVRAGQQIEWTVRFSEAVAFSKNNLTVTIGGVTVNSSQITVRGSGSSYTVTLKTTTALKGALVVAMKSGSAGPLDLRGNEIAVIPSNLAKTTII